MTQNFEPHVILESNQTGGHFPVGSLIELEGKPTYYRDVDSRHIFKPSRDYQAIGMDDAVVNYLEKAGAEKVAFYRTDTGERLVTNFHNYQASTPKTMRGRKQRFVRLASFEVEPNQQPLSRPTSKVVIGEQTE